MSQCDEDFTPADHLEHWRFNVALECSGASLCAIESIAVGGAVLTMTSLLEALEWASAEIERLKAHPHERGGERNEDMNEDMGAPCRDGLSQAEPEVSALRASIPSAEATVNDIPDNELLGRAVRGCRARHAGKSPRWVGVSDTFGLGSTYSRQLCRRFGVDPDEMIGRRR